MQSYAVKDYSIYEKLGQFQKATRCLQTALENNSNDLETFYMLHRLGEEVLDSTLKHKIAKVIDFISVVISQHPCHVSQFRHHGV